LLKRNALFPFHNQTCVVMIDSGNSLLQEFLASDFRPVQDRIFTSVLGRKDTLALFHRLEEVALF